MMRYNQGFYAFGPMEQAANGKWMKADDVQEELEKRDEQLRQAWTAAHRWITHCREWEALCDQSRELTAKAQRDARWLAVMALGQLTVLVAVFLTEVAK